jgi:hypothetical protein
MWGSFYYYPFYFLSVMQTTSLTAGVNLLPSLLTLIPMSIVIGILVTRFDNYRVPVWIGWTLIVICYIMAVIWRFVNVTTGLWVVTLMIFGTGHGIVLNAQQFAAQAMCKSGDEGRASATYLFVRQFGSAIGVGIGGTTFQNIMALKLGWEGLPTEIASQAEQYVATLHTMPDGDEKTSIIDAYRFGFGGVYSVFLGIAIVALILSLCYTKHYTLNKPLNTEHVLRGSRASKLLVRESKVKIITPAATVWDLTDEDTTYTAVAYPHTLEANQYGDPNAFYDADGYAYIPATYQPEMVSTGNEFVSNRDSHVQIADDFVQPDMVSTGNEFAPKRTEFVSNRNSRVQFADDFVGDVVDARQSEPNLPHTQHIPAVGITPMQSVYHPQVSVTDVDAIRRVHYSQAPATAVYAIPNVHYPQGPATAVYAIPHVYFAQGPMTAVSAIPSVYYSQGSLVDVNAMSGAHRPQEPGRNVRHSYH